MPLDGMQFGHYRLLRLIGSGGMGEVYLAEDVRIARQVAIKVIRTEATTQTSEQGAQESERLFQREMKAITLLDHPRILPLYDFGEETRENSEFTYMVMPYRPEGSLTDWLRRRGSDKPLLLQDVAHIIAQAADALQHAHDHQIVHQDVKPSNFLVRTLANKPERPDLLLTDFGIAKLITSTASMSQNIRGTPVYMAPEQWEGHPVFATDQYALGMMAYQLLVGRFPFSGRLEQLMHQHLHVPPQPPSRLNSRLSPAFDAILLRALAKKPEERFASISAFARAFQQAMHYAGDLRTTLTISPEEARQGTQRTITLPGPRHFSVTVPADAHDGQVLRIPGQGEPYYEDGPRGNLLLTIMLKRQSTPLSHSGEIIRPVSEPGFHQTNPIPSLPPVPAAQQIPVPPIAPVANPPSQPGLSHSGAIPVPHLNVPDTPQLAMTPSGAITPVRPYSNQQKSWRGALTTIKTSPSRNIIIVLIVLLFLLPGVLAVITTNHLQQLDQEQDSTATTKAMSLTATATASNPTAVALRATAQTIAANPYPPYLSKPQNDHGNLALFDSLNQAGEWQSHQNNAFGGSCAYKNGVFDDTETKSGNAYLCYGSSNFSDFAVEVQMKIIHGGCGGIAFRDNGANRDYTFEVCQDGTYSLYFYSTTKNPKTLLRNTSLAVHSGLNQTNTIAVKARGQTINLYINQQQINSVTDNSQGSGTIDFVADAFTASPTEVTYTRARIWTFA